MLIAENLKVWFLMKKMQKVEMSKSAAFRFYEELNDFIPPSKRKKTFPFSFKGNPAIKDTIEALGLVHTEIDLIIVNGKSVGFNYQLQDGDRVAVYPEFESLDISSLIHLRSAPLRNPAFICDRQLGRLSRFLRLFGFDTLYRNDFTHETIISFSHKEKRLILTRDRALLRYKSLKRGYWVRSTDPKKQIEEVITRFQLENLICPFSRCLQCNGCIVPVEKEEVLGCLKEKTRTYFDVFYQCQDCKKIFWKGSHYQNMLQKYKKWMKRSSV